MFGKGLWASLWEGATGYVLWLGGALRLPRVSLGFLLRGARGYAQKLGRATVLASCLCKDVWVHECLVSLAMLPRWSELEAILSSWAGMQICFPGGEAEQDLRPVQPGDWGPKSGRTSN